MSCKWTYTDIETGNKQEFNTKEDLDKFLIDNKEEILTKLNRPDILNQEARGAFDPANQIMYALTDPNVSTPVHELAHFWEKYLTDAERTQILDWSGHKSWTRETSENFAKGFEKYLSEGKAPTPELKSVFERFAKWLADIYKNVQKALGIELNDSMRNIYAEMLNSKVVSEEVKTEIKGTLEEATKPNVTIKVSSKDQQVYKIEIKNNNKKVGEIKAVNDGTHLTINEANVKTPRQGIGIEAYRQAAQEAQKLGLVLQSDSIANRLTPEAKGLWDKLVASGEALKGKDNYTYQVKEEAGTTETVKVYRGQQIGTTGGNWFTTSREFAQKFADSVKGKKKSNGEVAESEITGNIFKLPHLVTDYAKISDKLGEIFGVTKDEIINAIKTTDEPLSKSESIRIHSLLENKGFQDLLASKGIDYVQAKERLNPTTEVDTFIKINKSEKAPEVAKPTLSNKVVSEHFNNLFKANRDLLENLLYNWNESELVVDGDSLKVKSHVGRDGRYSKGKEGGAQYGGKKGFIEWVLSDQPFDKTKYSQDKEWIDDVNKARDIINGKKVEEPTPNKEPLSYTTNIDYQTGLDGENKITVVDHEGNLIENPDNEIDGYTFDTNKDAENFIDKYNKEKGLVVEKPKEEKKPEEKPKEKPKEEKQEPVVDKFEKPEEDQQEAASVETVKVKENKELSRPEDDLNVLDIVHNGEVIDSIYENIEERGKVGNYGIEGNDRDGYNVTENNRFIKAKSEKDVTYLDEDGIRVYGEITSEHERYFNVTLNNGEKVQVKKSKVEYAEKSLEFNTREEAQAHIDKLNEENAKPVSTGWFTVNGDDLGVNTKAEAVKAVIENYNDKNGLTKPLTEAKKEYIHFTVGRGDKKVNLVGEVKKVDSLGAKSSIYTLVDKDGNVHEKTITNNSKLVPATEEEFKNQKTIDKPQPKWEDGAKVKLEDGTTVNIQSSDVHFVSSTGEHEIIYKTTDGTLIPEEAIAGRSRKTIVENFEEQKQKQAKRVKVLTSIAEQFSKLFGGDIEYKIHDMNIYDSEGNFIAYPFEAPARFNNGIVEINTGYSDKKYTADEIRYHNENDPFDVPWLKRETVAHEFMHPFVLSLKLSNEVLYDSLIKELRENHPDIIDHVEKLVKRGTYKEELKGDEALTIYLGRELTKAFTKDGVLDREYVKNKPLLQKFVDWLHDIVDFILGKKKPKTLEQFVQDANINKGGQKELVLKTMSEIEELKKVFTAKDNDIVKKVRKILKEQEKVKELLKDNPEAYDKLYEVVNNYKNNVNVGGQFEFSVRPNAEHFVEFDTTDRDNVKVYIDPKLSDESSLGSILTQYGKDAQNIILKNTAKELGIDYTDFSKEELLKQKGMEEALDKAGYFLFDNYAKSVNENFYQFGSKQEGARQIGIKNLNPLMKLQDLNNYILYQLANDQQVKIQYTPDEFAAIDKLEAYMELEEPRAEKIRKAILKKFPLLKETADKRLASETLKANYNFVNKINLDENDVNFVLKYIDQANTSLSIAYRQWFDMLGEMRLKEGKLTKPELTRLNKEFGVVRQLLSFYDEFKQYSRFEDSFSNEEIVKYNKTMRYMDNIRDSMNDTAINLTVEWFNKYAEQHNKYIQKEGYTDEAYLVTPEKLRNFFKYGTGRDTNYITYWLGSNITSRDPINAMFANTLSDMLSFNNIDITYKSFDVNEGFNKFLKAKGIGNITNNDQVKYYKENYLREAEKLVYDYNEYTGERTEKYIKKLALHQEFLFDKYEKELADVRKKYSEPRSSEEADFFDSKIEEWQQSKNYGKSEEYRNPEYAKLQGDEYFKLLEKYYNESNDRYGDNKLKYGIIPQKYHVDYLDKVKKFVDGVKSDEPFSEKLKEAAHKAKVKFAGIEKDNRQYNLDGSLYREVSSSLTDLKNDENVSLDLHSSIVDFITESTNYASLKETQYQAETLSLLLTGNTKFDIKARTFAQEDFAKKIVEPRQLEKAKEKLKELQEAKDNGDPYDEVLYKTLTEKVDKGIQSQNVWDKFVPLLKPSKTNNNNEMLLQQINDIYFGEGQENVKFGNISVNKLAHYLGLYTSINNMAGNVVAGISNINIGNLQLFIEGHGGQYFNKKELVKASLDYVKNIPEFIKDLQSPIKSKDTQLSFLLDAIQGEVQDEFGTRITGNIAKKMFRTNSLFLLTSLGEHQIQITGMKAMLMGRKVEVKGGGTISLYDAFVKDENGRYALRKDIEFSQEDLAKFIRDLHGVNRALNGNYSNINKTMLARKWYGTLMLKFRKYLYPSFRARFASTHVDYERNTVDTGYLRYFAGTYIPNGIKHLYQKLSGNGGENFTKLQPFERIAARKAFFELCFYGALTALGVGLMSGGPKGDKGKKKLTSEEKFGLLLVLRLRSDLDMYHVGMPSEVNRQLKNPTASLQTIVAASNFFQQLFNPNEVYDKKYGNHQKGDSKLKADFYQLIPILKQFNANIDNKLGYYSLINRNIEGVAPKSSLP